MKEILMIRLTERAVVTSIENAVGVSPRALLVTGQDLRNVDYVTVDGHQSPEVITVSNTKLLVQVPALLVNSPIQDVVVFTATLNARASSAVELTLGSSIQGAQGMIRLLQNFVRLLLRRPGSNAFRRKSGGGLRRAIGGNLNSDAAVVAIDAVNRTASYIIAAQAQDSRIPKTERLLKAAVTSATQPTPDALEVVIELYNHTGERGVTALQF